VAERRPGAPGERRVGEDDPFSITVLGTDGSYPGPRGACSGYLLRAAGFATWMDAGSGTMANLQAHMSLADLGAVVVSHSHPDHWSDLEGLYIALRYFVGRSGLPVYAPEGLRELMRGEVPDGTFDWRTIGDGESAQVGPARWHWSRTDHPVETLAARVQVAGRALAYSADTGPAWELSRLGEGIQLALVEASLSLEAEGSIQHLSARQAGATAAAAGAERLVITHLTPPIDRELARKEAAAAFRGSVDVAEVGKTWAI
jgi:ribonuclease BN (tRNA processing enzyme)